MHSVSSSQLSWLLEEEKYVLTEFDWGNWNKDPSTLQRVGG